MRPFSSSTKEPQKLISFFINTSSLLPQNHPEIPIMQLLILLYMLWAICPAQVNVSNYRKWELQS